jgi:hypothetical protein
VREEEVNFGLRCGKKRREGRKEKRREKHESERKAQWVRLGDFKGNTTKLRLTTTNY